MTKYYSMLVLLLSLITCSCAFESTNQSADKGCSIDSLQVLNIEAPEIATLYRVNHSIGDGVILAYNTLRHTLDWIDLNKEEKVLDRRLDLASEGPRGIEKVRGLFYHNQDSIFLLSAYHFYLISYSGQLLKKVRINNEGSPIKGIDFTQHFIYANGKNGVDMYYDADEDALYLGCKASRYDQFTIPEHYQAPLVGKWNLGENRVDLLDIYYPEQFLSNSYGLLNRPNITFVPGKIIYNFKISSKVYIYDMNTQETEIIDLPSRYAVQEAVAFTGNSGDPEQMVEHINKTSDYGKLTYNPYNNKYYRSIFVPNASKPGTKKQIFNVLSSSFELLQDTEVPKGTIVFSGLIPSSKGVYAACSTDSEDQKRFRLLTLTGCPY